MPKQLAGGVQVGPKGEHHGCKSVPAAVEGDFFLYVPRLDPLFEVFVDAWRLTAVKEMGKQRYAELSAKCPSKDLAKEFISNRFMQLELEQLAKARASALITDISAYTQPDLTPEAPAFSNPEEFIDLLTKDENGNSVLPTDIKVDAALDCSKSWWLEWPTAGYADLQRGGSSRFCFRCAALVRLFCGRLQQGGLTSLWLRRG